jgi:tetratricopeptide (TPR) repeat protein
MTVNDAAAALVLSIAFVTQAVAGDTVIGTSYARQCEEAAERASNGLTVDPAGAGACDQAIEVQALAAHDLAATHVNRGILALIRHRYDAARVDFDEAIALAPNLGGAYSNRGAVLIAKGEPAAGVAAIDIGLSLGTPSPERAYFNRGLGREALGDVKGAYLDYLEAQHLKPDWPEPTQELARFKVTKRKLVNG